MKTRLKTEPMRLYSKALLLNLCLLLVAVSTVHAGDNNLLSTVKTDQILPVTFHSFTTTLEKNHVVLKWSVDTDDNFSLYVIERSLDGKNFKEAGIVLTTSFTEISHYEFIDEELTATTGMVYYRLRWEEKTKLTYFSAVRIVKLGIEKAENEVIAYPNPAKNELKITLPESWQGKPLNLEIYAASGTVLQQRSIGSASQTETITIGQLKPGIYFVRARSGENLSQQRIIKD
jgi:hypothetical protein